MRVLTLAAVVTLVSACLTVHPLRYEPYGEFSPSERERIVKEYESALPELSPEESAAIKILNASFPAGIRMDGDFVSVDPGAPYELVSHFEIAYFQRFVLPSDVEVERDLKRLAKSANAQLVVVKLKYKQPDHPYVTVANGYLIRVKASPEPNAGSTDT